MPIVQKKLEMKKLSIEMPALVYGVPLATSDIIIGLQELVILSEAGSKEGLDI
jgi:hypothetical protein